jgi:processive 1,2-diacylglycerol beta-glucosyltransferase
MKTNQELKVLILYASYGDGHIQVSKALQQCFLDKGVNRVQMVDLYASAHPLLDAVTRFVYLVSCSYCPGLYGWSYYLTQNMQHKWTPVKFLNTFGIGALREIIRLERPDAVINTFPMAVMSELRKQAGLKIPIFTVLTDFVLHDRWLHQEIDKYYVATEELKTAIINKGIPAGRIKVSGIPLRQAFYRQYNKNQILLHYGLDPLKKIVLIMAGAYGVMQSLKRLCQALLHLEGIQILLVCGKNQSLKERIEATFDQNPNISIFGFVEHIEALMAISSCLITKAGGITLSEALALNLPAIIYRPLPGQERENAFFLAKKGAVMIADNTEEVVRSVRQIVYQEQQALQMQQAGRMLQGKNASEMIVNDVLNEIMPASVELL